jgi:hypothetical protein
MRITQNRTWGFPPNVNQIFDGKKVCKRPVYKPAYCLLTCAYFGAYIAAYLLFTEKAGSDFLSQIRLILRLENIASPAAS